MSRMHKSTFRPQLEILEDRVVPYALSGYQWAASNISVSLMPEGTSITSQADNLLSTLDAEFSREVWQTEF